MNDNDSICFIFVSMLLLGHCLRLVYERNCGEIMLIVQNVLQATYPEARIPWEIVDTHRT